MASILPIGKKWRAQIRRVGSKPATKTFATKRDAEAWARGMEHHADTGRPIGGGSYSIKSLIIHYETAKAESPRPVVAQSAEWYMLERLKASTLAGLQLQKLNKAAILDFCRARKAEGAGPSTIGMDLSKLRTALKYACSLLEIPFHDPIESARPTLHYLGLIGPGKKRDRRPSADEWARLLAALNGLQTALPMVDIVQLAALIGIRRAEVVRLKWADLDQEKRIVIVRDRKHPRKKRGNDVPVPLVGGSLDIIMRQPRNDDRIFPYTVDSISKQFLLARRSAGIEDLRFHDMRHEAASSLFEAGWAIPEVAAVTGHQTWGQLRRYTNLDPAKIAQKEI